MDHPQGDEGSAGRRCHVSVPCMLLIYWTGLTHLNSHTDFERGFIMAEVMKYDDLKELGSENAVKGAGKYQQKGKEYVVDDGDIILFKFNVTTQKKK